MSFRPTAIEMAVIATRVAYTVASASPACFLPFILLLALSPFSSRLSMRLSEQRKPSIGASNFSSDVHAFYFCFRTIHSSAYSDRPFSAEDDLSFSLVASPVSKGPKKRRPDLPLLTNKTPRSFTQ